MLFLLIYFRPFPLLNTNLYEGGGVARTKWFYRKKVLDFPVDPGLRMEDSDQSLEANYNIKKKVNIKFFINL